MTAKAIDGKAAAADLRAAIGDEVTRFRATTGRAPGLAVVLVGDAVDLHNPKTLRASAGSAFHVPVAVEPDPVRAVEAARAAGLTVLAYGAVNLKRDVPLPDSFGSIELDGEAERKIGFNAGIMFRPSEKFSLGLNYRSKIDAQVKGGDVTFTGIAPGSAPGFVAMQLLGGALAVGAIVVLYPDADRLADARIGDTRP